MKSCVRDKAFITKSKKSCRTPTLSCANSPNFRSYNVMRRRARYTQKINATLKERNSLFRKFKLLYCAVGLPWWLRWQRICLLCRGILYHQSHQGSPIWYVSLEINYLLNIKKHVRGYLVHISPYEEL